MDQATYEARLAKAIEYLRLRNKYLLDPECEFKPTPYTDTFSIVERYKATGSPRSPLPDSPDTPV